MLDKNKKYEIYKTYMENRCEYCGLIDRGIIINKRHYCKNCARYLLEDIIIDLHTETENNKTKYADKHLEILQKQREERQILKDIIKSQNDEMKVSEFYSKYIKGGE